MIHEDNNQWHHHPTCEGEDIPETIALVGGRGLGGSCWPTVHYTVGESLHLVLQGTHSSLQVNQRWWHLASTKCLWHPVQNNLTMLNCIIILFWWELYCKCMFQAKSPPPWLARIYRYLSDKDKHYFSDFRVLGCQHGSELSCMAMDRSQQEQQMYCPILVI